MSSNNTSNSSNESLLLEELKKMIKVFEPFAKEAQYVSGIFMAKTLVEKVEKEDEPIKEFYCRQQKIGRRDDTCSEQCDSCVLQERK